MSLFDEQPTKTGLTIGPKPMSAKTIAILEATALIVKEHGTEITSAMYGIMFSEFPEVQNLFNMSHHRVAGATKGGAPPGVSRQATTLANAVIDFAANCDKLDIPGDAVPRMVHKHVSLDIRASHYPIVGECLLRAIKRVLGEAATDEIMDAWEEAYWFLAHLLIQAEENLRVEFERMLGGWIGYRELRVARKVKESDEVTSLYLESIDPSKRLMTFKPGQFLSLKFDHLQPGRSIVRNYSVSSAPGQKFYRISLKKSRAAPRTTSRLGLSRCTCTIKSMLAAFCTWVHHAIISTWSHLRSQSYLSAVGWA